ncbi:hypothetical protein K435DRAFT_600868, partial [Dendrothele bispora CBS 962.96]
GHISYSVLRAMIREGLIAGLQVSKKDLKGEPPLCGACAKGKSTRTSFTLSDSHAEGFLDLIHSDLIGPMPVQSSGGAQYAITFTDDH